MITRDTYVKKIMPFIDKPLIKVLVGIRRAGKSTLLEMVKEYLVSTGVKADEILVVNFELTPYAKIRTRDDFLDFIDEKITKSGQYRYLLFDEVQYVEGWDECVNGLLAAQKYDIYVTGSNSKLLSGELSTYLTGRYIEIRVDTLTFAEYLDFKRERGTEMQLLATEFNNYLQMGGFPVLHLADYQLEQVDSLMSDIYASIVYRDLVTRKNIRNTDLLDRLIRYVFDNIGNLFSAKSVSDYLKNEHRNIKPETIYNYLKWLEEVFVIQRVNRYDIRGRELLKTQEKFYLGDIGLLYAVNDRNGSYLSGLLENVVYHELIAKGYKVRIGRNGEKEIDFIAERRGELMYLQVAAHITDEATSEREFSAFAGIDDNYPKYVLTLDENWLESHDGITQQFLPQFLLDLK